MTMYYPRHSRAGGNLVEMSGKSIARYAYGSALNLAIRARLVRTDARGLGSRLRGDDDTSGGWR